MVKDEIAVRDEGEIVLKGIPHPVRAYKVLGIYDDLVEPENIIRFDQPGMRLLVNPDELTPDNRKVALAALDQAAARLKQQSD